MRASVSAFAPVSSARAVARAHVPHACASVAAVSVVPPP
jgi:hypothetical protein